MGQGLIKVSDFWYHLFTLRAENPVFHYLELETIATYTIYKHLSLTSSSGRI